MATGEPEEFPNKLEIIQRLLNSGHINNDEAEQLGGGFFIQKMNPFKIEPFKEVEPNIFPAFPPIHDFSYMEKCSCNPKNGGNGLCGCTLGAPSSIC